jgi:hypothetical protein
VSKNILHINIINFRSQTCAKVVEYPLSGKTVAFVQQWIDGNKVYDDVFPKEPENKYYAEVYRNTVGEHEVTVTLRLLPDDGLLRLESTACEPERRGLPGPCQIPEPLPPGSRDPYPIRWPVP